MVKNRVIPDGATSFQKIYDLFLSKITDDMYMELTPEDTKQMLEELLISALPSFEFPRQDMSYERSIKRQEEESYLVNNEIITKTADVFDLGFFYSHLTDDEMNVIATYMVVQWLGQQLANVDLTREKYSGADFKFTSQANHMQKLLQLKLDYQREGFHLQRLYKRRIKNSQGIYRSTLGQIMMTPSSIQEERNGY